MNIVQILMRTWPLSCTLYCKNDCFVHISYTDDHRQGIAFFPSRDFYHKTCNQSACCILPLTGFLYSKFFLGRLSVFFPTALTLWRFFICFRWLWVASAALTVSKALSSIKSGTLYVIIYNSKHNAVTNQSLSIYRLLFIDIYRLIILLASWGEQIPLNSEIAFFQGSQNVSNCSNTLSSFTLSSSLSHVKALYTFKCSSPSAVKNWFPLELDLLFWRFQ